MADKCCNSNNDAKSTENKTESCCTSNKDSVNSFNSIPILIQEKTSCCSSHSSKETDNELEKVSCCSTSLPSGNKLL